MPRAKKSAADTSADTTTNNDTEAKPLSKAEVVRRALAEGLSERDDIIAFGVDRYGIEIPKAQVGAYKAQVSGKKSKPKVKGRRSAEGEGDLAPPKIEAKGDGDLLDALEAMKLLVASLGVERVKRLAELLG